MPQRILTATVGVPITVALIWVGLPWLTIAVGLVALLALREFYQIAAVIGARTFLPLGLIWTALFLASAEISSQPFLFWAPIIGGGVLATVLWMLAHRSQINLFKSGIYMVMGPLILGLLFSHGLMLREVGDSTDVGRSWLLLAISATFATDSGAFLIGQTLGHHLMAPTISPGKTWEGALGGLLCAIGTAIGLGALFDLSTSLWHYAIIGSTIGIMAQLGDLAESRLKRAAGLKDSGGILPGHGGMLDRLDSIVFTLPLVYYLAVLVE